jgi:hypothetical protein
MREQAKLNQRIRELLTKLLNSVEKELETTTELKAKLTIAESLGAMMAAGSKAIESTAKHTVGGPEEEERQEVNVLAEMMKGRKS